MECQPFDEETAGNELFVVYNGPEIGEAKEALGLHFENSHGWHFTTNNYLKKKITPTVAAIFITICSNTY